MKKITRTVLITILFLFSASILIFDIGHTRSFLLKPLARQFGRLSATEYVLSSQTQNRINDSIVFYIGKPDTLVKGRKQIIDASDPKQMPFVRNNQVFAPAKFIAESLGAQVLWDSQTGTMNIKIGNELLEYSQIVFIIPL